MTLTITNQIMTSDHTPHTARPVPGRQHAWQVSRVAEGGRIEGQWRHWGRG